MKFAALVPVVLLTACASSPSSSPEDLLLGLGKVHKTTPAAKLKGALGTEGNPVRVLMPPGEREYLHRLRCDNGAPPNFERSGSAGISPYGTIMDIYQVHCEATGVKATIFMDMYHCQQETRAVPGFDIVPPLGKPAASDQCE